MTEKRRMSMAVTVFITADLTTEDAVTNIAVVTAEHMALGNLLPIGEVVPSTPAWQQRMGMEVSKLGLKFVVDKMTGEHKDEVPAVNHPGADA
jgi:hypothetical protein